MEPCGQRFAKFDSVMTESVAFHSEVAFRYGLGARTLSQQSADTQRRSMRQLHHPSTHFVNVHALVRVVHC